MKKKKKDEKKGAQNACYGAKSLARRARLTPLSAVRAAEKPERARNASASIVFSVLVQGVAQEEEQETRTRRKYWPSQLGPGRIKEKTNAHYTNHTRLPQREPPRQ